jgi:hypothetical protein
MRQIQIRRSKTKNATSLAASSALDLRTPSGRQLPY